VLRAEKSKRDLNSASVIRADILYMWFTQEKNHLKNDCTYVRCFPFVWNRNSKAFNHLHIIRLINHYTNYDEYGKN